MNNPFTSIHPTKQQSKNNNQSQFNHNGQNISYLQPKIDKQIYNINQKHQAPINLHYQQSIKQSPFQYSNQYLTKNQKSKIIGKSNQQLTFQQQQLNNNNLISILQHTNHQLQKGQFMNGISQHISQLLSSSKNQSHLSSQSNNNLISNSPQPILYSHTDLQTNNILYPYTKNIHSTETLHYKNNNIYQQNTYQHQQIHQPTQYPNNIYQQKMHANKGYQNLLYQSNQPYFPQNKNIFQKPLPQQLHQINYVNAKEIRFYNSQIPSISKQQLRPQQILSNKNSFQKLTNKKNIQQQKLLNLKNQREVPRQPLKHIQNNTFSQTNYPIFGTEINLSLDLQQVIKEQMLKFSIDGKYRTFLTAKQKIITIKYNLQPI